MAAIMPHLSLAFSKFSTLSQFHSLPSSLHHRNLAIFCCLSLKQPHDQTSGTTQNDNLRVVFAAGGTGGHIYPAVAIAEELKILNPSCEIPFIGTTNSVESTVVSSSGFNFTPVPSVRLARPLISLQNLFLPCYLVKSLVQCSLKLRNFKPHVVVGTGGLVSFPVCVAAKLLGIKLVIQEQNLVPGTENSILALLADVIFVAFNSTIDSFPRNKCVVCGNPVRLSLRKHVSKSAAMSHFFTGYEYTGNSDKAKVLLVLGGSFGANAINIAMLNLYYQMLRRSDSLYIIWQTGFETYDEMESLVKIHPRLYLRPFMHRLDLAYAAADLVVSRAGALTCYEILATGKPSILIPSPDVSEGHQFKNASMIADLTGATVITEDELDSSTLAIAIELILSMSSSLPSSHFIKIFNMREETVRYGTLELLGFLNLDRENLKAEQVVFDCL